MVTSTTRPIMDGALVRVGLPPSTHTHRIRHTLKMRILNGELNGSPALTKLSQGLIILRSITGGRWLVRIIRHRTQLFHAHLQGYLAHKKPPTPRTLQ